MPRSVPVVSARRSNNPYGVIRTFCVESKTVAHAQIVGILSFCIFLSLTVLSAVVINDSSIFYTVFGIIAYAFLAESLFRRPYACGVLVYLVFETIQIGFFIVTFILLFVILILPVDPLPTPSPNTTTTTATTTTMTAYGTIVLSEFDVLMIFMFCLVLLVLKLYFVRVFTHFYKFLVYQQQHATDLTAEYIRGGGVNLSFPDTSDHTTYGAFPGFVNLPPLPSYDQTVSVAKEGPRDEEQQESQQRRAEQGVEFQRSPTHTSVDLQMPPST